jgi:type I restriction enzyme S subunit
MTGDVNQEHLQKLDKLPAGWAEASVNDIVKMISTNGKKLPQKKYMEKAEYPVIDQGQGFIGGYHEDESLLIDGEPPYVVFGDHSRAFKFPNFKFIPGADGVKIMQPIGVDPKWAFYMFQAIRLPDKGYDCSGLIEPDTLIRDNIYQLLRCRNGTKTNEQTVF